MVLKCFSVCAPTMVYALMSLSVPVARGFPYSRMIMMVGVVPPTIALTSTFKSYTFALVMVAIMFSPVVVADITPAVATERAISYSLWSHIVMDVDDHACARRIQTTSKQAVRRQLPRRVIFDNGPAPRRRESCSESFSTRGRIS